MTIKAGQLLVLLVRREKVIEIIILISRKKIRLQLSTFDHKYCSYIKK